MSEMAHGVNSRSQKEYDEPPKDNEVHYPRVEITQKAPVGQNVPNRGADENPYSSADVLGAVIGLSQAPQLVAPIDTEGQKSYGDGVQYVHHITVLYVPEYFSGWQNLSSSLL
jgi:hypothetical protein